MIKKNENEDVGLLSGTQVMEGSGRMVVLGVGLNSQVGVIMNLLGATEGSNASKDKKKDKKRKSDMKKDESRTSKLATSPNDGAKVKSASAEGPELHQLLPKNETKQDDDGQKNAAVTTAPALEEVAAEDDGAGANEGKNRCKKASVDRTKIFNGFSFDSFSGDSNEIGTLSSLHQLHW